MIFPRFISYCKAIPDIIHRKKQHAYLEPFNFINDESIELTKYLISRFCKETLLKHSKPIMLLMYSRFELNGILKNKREDEWLIQFFNEKKE